MSIADLNFQKLIKKVLSEGVSTEGQKVRPKWDDGTPAHTISIFGEYTEYDLAEEFPIHTIRPTAFKSCIDEILWIWQKKSNNVHNLNSHIWDSWADENGSIGKAYGYQLAVKHRYNEGEFDQVNRVLYDLVNNPMSRRIMTNLYNHADLIEMKLAPCVYGCTFNVSSGKLNMMVNQRSADLITAGGWNLTQYAVLAHMFAQASGLKPGKLVYVIGDAHIYDRHIDFAKDLAERVSYPAPQLEIDPNITDFYKFKVDSFILTNYQTGPQINKIPVAV